MTDEMQPDEAVDFVARVCSGVRDIEGARLSWWWRGDSAVRLLAERQGVPSVTLDLRELRSGSAVHATGTLLAAGDVIQILLGRRGPPKSKRVAA